jgi:DNA-binding response OmpR family regulator
MPGGMLVSPLSSSQVFAARRVRRRASDRVRLEGAHAELRRVAGFLIGGDDYLVKPFALDEFAARMRGLAGVPASDLTRRELEVLKLLVDGLSQNEVARRLFISPKTAVIRPGERLS